MKQGKNQDQGLSRWVIKSFGVVIHAEYDKQKASRYASDYYERCVTQDDPFDPQITIEKEDIK